MIEILALSVFYTLDPGACVLSIVAGVIMFAAGTAGR